MYLSYVLANISKQNVVVYEAKDVSKPQATKDFQNRLPTRTQDEKNRRLCSDSRQIHELDIPRVL